MQNNKWKLKHINTCCVTQLYHIKMQKYANNDIFFHSFIYLYKFIFKKFPLYGLASHLLQSNFVRVREL